MFHRGILFHRAVLGVIIACTVACGDVALDEVSVRRTDDVAGGKTKGKGSGSRGDGIAADGDGEVHTAVIDTPNGPLEVRYTRVNGRDMAQGDIVLPGSSRLQGAAANKRESQPWPNGVIPYTIAPGMPEQNRVTEAIAHWEQNTPIRFVRRTNEAAYVNFMAGDGCYSAIGRTGQKQDISLGQGCPTGHAIHEIGHAVGLWHEQSRSDRDQHIRVNLQNVVAGMEHNFDKMQLPSAGPYDLKSIMHYEPEAFSKNGQPTMTTLDGQRYQVNDQVLSPGDIAGVKALYADAGNGVDPGGPPPGQGGPGPVDPAPPPPPPPPPGNGAGPGEAITTSRAYLHEGPDAAYAVIFILAAGVPVYRTGESEAGYDEVVVEGEIGWVASQALSP